jgi:S1-C subfamily serine protease
MITNVLTNGPAAGAGIKVGDTILAIDGRAVSDFGVDTAKRLLAAGVVAEGQVVTLALARGATVKITAASWQ